MVDLDFTITVEEIETPVAGCVQPPSNFVEEGVADEEIKVYIRRDVYERLEKYAHSDTDTELGSILIGDFAESDGEKYIMISDYIEAKYTDATAFTLTFTHETWNYVYAEKGRLFPDKKIIGWQHTHPDYGVFLSSYDMFIQENFFNLPFQVAYVIDPIRNIRGFFGWKDGAVKVLTGFYIYEE